MLAAIDKAEAKLDTAVEHFSARAKIKEMLEQLDRMPDDA
jgi:hypothetical protein